MRSVVRLFVVAGLLLGAAITVAAATPAKDEPTTVCVDGVCTTTGTDDDKDDDDGPSGPNICRWQGRVVACTAGSKHFDSSSGCYVGPPSEPPSSGPVLTQFRKYGGSIVFATCPFGGTGGYLWLPPAKPVVTAALVREEAVRLIPSAEVGVAPKGTTLVNIETVLWADAPPKQALPQVTLVGQKVVITLELNRVSWDFGDGQQDADAPAGKAYDGRNDPCREKSCSHYYGHVYARTGKVEIAAIAYWHATFTVDGGAAQDAGDVPGPRATGDVVVKQARGVLVPNPGESP